jgi:hypothetical protein
LPAYRWDCGYRECGVHKKGPEEVAAKSGDIRKDLESLKKMVKAEVFGLIEDETNDRLEKIAAVEAEFEALDPHDQDIISKAEEVRRKVVSLSAA